MAPSALFRPLPLFAPIRPFSAFFRYLHQFGGKGPFAAKGLQAHVQRPQGLQAHVQRPPGPTLPLGAVRDTNVLLGAVTHLYRLTYTGRWTTSDVPLRAARHGCNFVKGARALLEASQASLPYEPVQASLGPMGPMGLWEPHRPNGNTG